MKKTDRNALLALPAIIGVGVLVAWAGSQGGVRVGNLPVFALAVGLAFLIQWVVFIPAFVFQSEKFFDLTGSLSYITIITATLILSGATDARAILVFILVLVWAARLGTFLFLRVKKAGKDDRFDQIKPSFLRFLNVWTLQGLWITLTLAAALVAITSSYRKGFDAFAVIGLLIWILGFVIEVASDLQKSRFNANPANKGKFINSGLWSRSRHPNYFGEITLWLGIAVMALPVLRGWQWIALISPLFVTLLLTKVSGIPLLEKKSDKKWGGQEDYEAYKKKTPVLIPKIW